MKTPARFVPAARGAASTGRLGRRSLAFRTALAIPGGAATGRGAARGLWPEPRGRKVRGSEAGLLITLITTASASFLACRRALYPAWRKPQTLAASWQAWQRRRTARAAPAASGSAPRR